MAAFVNLQAHVLLRSNHTSSRVSTALLSRRIQHDLGSPSTFCHRGRHIFSYHPVRISNRANIEVTRCSVEAGAAQTTKEGIEVIDPSSTDDLIQSLQKMDMPPPEAVMQDMVRHLGDSRGLARLALVDTFGKIGSPAVASLLHSLKHSPNPVVRRSCGKALAKIGDPLATPTLMNALVYDEDTVTRSSAAGALAKMGATAISPLLKLIADPSVNMTAKGHAAWAIAFMQSDADATSTLLSELQTDNADVRIAIVSALGAVAIGDALPSMTGNSVDDWDEDGEDGNNNKAVKQSAINAIALTLDDADPQVRAEAATALANAVSIEHTPRIAKMLQDPDPEARRCAALSLMKLGDTAFLTDLDRVCNDEKEIDDVKKVARLAANTIRRRMEDDDSDWD